MELGYARVSTTKQDLGRQVDALTGAGIESAHIYADKKSGATVDRPGLKALLYDHRNCQSLFGYAARVHERSGGVPAPPVIGQSPLRAHSPPWALPDGKPATRSVYALASAQIL